VGKKTAMMTGCLKCSRATWNGDEGRLEMLRASARCRQGRTRRFAAPKNSPRGSDDAAEQGRDNGSVGGGTTLLYWPNQRKNGGSPSGFRRGILMTWKRRDA
jgi:hypothetical protein